MAEATTILFFFVGLVLVGALGYLLYCMVTGGGGAETKKTFADDELSKQSFVFTIPQGSEIKSAFYGNENDGEKNVTAALKKAVEDVNSVDSQGVYSAPPQINYAVYTKLLQSVDTAMSPRTLTVTFKRG